MLAMPNFEAKKVFVLVGQRITLQVDRYLKGFSFKLARAYH